MRHGDQFRLFVQKSLESLYVERLILAQGNMPQHRFLALTEHLPRYNVGMVLYGRYDNLVALVNESLTERESQGIETVRRAFREDDLVATLRSDERCHSFSRLLMFHRCYLAQMMHAAVDIAVPMGVSLRDGIYHRLRLLARSGIIQVHQGASVYLLVQYREICSVHTGLLGLGSFQLVKHESLTPAKVQLFFEICKFYGDFLKFAPCRSFPPRERKKKKKRTKRIIKKKAQPHHHRRW